MPSGGRSYRRGRSSRGIDDFLEKRRKDLEGVAQRLSGADSSNKPVARGPQGDVIKTSMGRRAQIRAGSIGVSSSSRQRTNRRGPGNRSRKTRSR